jgi:hypothetical protein
MVIYPRINLDIYARVLYELFEMNRLCLSRAGLAR